MNNLNEQFGRVYDQYIEKIYRFVYLKVNSQEIAEDITSKVFMKGWEAYKTKSDIQNSKSETKSEIQNIGAFLYQIARNAVIDYYRDKDRIKVVSADLSAEIIDSRISAHDKAVLNADIEIIKRAIVKLNHEYQDIIIWHYLDDMPVADIAKLLNKPAGTVRVALHRGLKELRGIIQEG